MINFTERLVNLVSRNGEKRELVETANDLSAFGLEVEESEVKKLRAFQEPDREVLTRRGAGLKVVKGSQRIV